MKQKFQTTLIVYLAMIAAVVIYAVLIQVLKNNPQFQTSPLPAEQITILRYVFYFLALTNFFAIGFLRKMMLLRMVIAYKTQVPAPAGQYPNSVFNSDSESDSDSETEADSSPLSKSESGSPLPNFVAIEIVTFALCESVAIYGLFLFFLGKRPEDFYPFMAIALGYLAVYFPKYSQWEEWESKLKSC